MIEFGIVAKVLSIFLLAVISPGPDFMIVSSVSLTRGRVDGIKTAAGIASIIVVYTLVSLTGLSELFTHYLGLTMAIKMCGGLYLIYLSQAMWRGSFGPRQVDVVAPVSRQKSAYRLGVLTCLTNPKAIAFFASIFALALTPDTTLATKVTIGILVPTITLLWFSFVAFGLSKAKVRAHYQRWQHVIDRITGTVLGVFGLKLILSARW
jgi:RhtB (resistance to homoserine/threonine) family protein